MPKRPWITKDTGTNLPSLPWTQARENSYGFSSTESPITPMRHWTKISIGEIVAIHSMQLKLATRP